ncbi:MAG: FAD-binding protein, partial [Oscillospiraceae bacterium]|nr:FAD-binding protein [Oscillospiraceae bacterium]
SMQVGLTGKTVSPSVYIAVGVSGAVHHIVGMQRSGTIIAINPDKDARIFEYVDYGILEEF